MYIDSGEVVRVRVEADDFCDDEPGPTKASEGAVAAAQQPRRAPYMICVNVIFSYWSTVWLKSFCLSVLLRNRVSDLLHGGLVPNRLNQVKMTWTKARIRSIHRLVMLAPWSINVSRVRFTEIAI